MDKIRLRRSRYASRAPGTDCTLKYTPGRIDSIRYGVALQYSTVILVLYKPQGPLWRPDISARSLSTYFDASPGSLFGSPGPLWTMEYKCTEPVQLFCFSLSMGPFWLDSGPLWLDVWFLSPMTVCFFYTNGPLWLDSGPLWLDVCFENQTVTSDICFFYTNGPLWFDTGPLWLDVCFEKQTVTSDSLLFLYKWAHLAR